jgi:hypothetical protein
MRFGGLWETEDRPSGARCLSVAGTSARVAIAQVHRQARSPERSSERARHFVSAAVIRSQRHVASPKTPSEFDVRARRLVGGARREASERVVIRSKGFETQGWTLNVSRGGLRVVVEETLQQGVEYEVVVGDSNNDAARAASVVWVKQAADGQIVGLQYLDSEGSFPPSEE